MSSVSLHRASLRQKLKPYGYLAPALISITVLSIAPTLFTIGLAFTDASLYNFKTGFSFVGLANFKEIFNGSLAKVFFPVFGWNILYATLCALTQYSLGMFLAVLLNNRHMRESNLYRSLFIIPWAIPGTIATLAWAAFFNTSGGQINLALTQLFGIDPIPWLQHPNLAKVATLLVNLWMGFPFFMTVCLGALSSIPNDLYEAAEIDGASNWQKFWRVTFPLMFKFTIPLLIGSFALNFNNLNTAILLTNGMPPRAASAWAGHTDILASVGYKLTINLNRYALSAAMSVILYIIVAGLTWFNMKVTGAFGEEEAV